MRGRYRSRLRCPKCSPYFDCTDYVDQDDGGKQARPLLTFAKWRKRNYPEAKLRWYSHLYLLLAYVIRGQKPNVHGGYFEGLFSQQLIYRLACLGYNGTVAAYGSEVALGKACEQKQIRMLVSPRLWASRVSSSAPPPPVQPTMRPMSRTIAPAPPAPAIGVVPNLVGRSIVEARAAVA